MGQIVGQICPCTWQKNIDHDLKSVGMSFDEAKIVSKDRKDRKDRKTAYVIKSRKCTDHDDIKKLKHRNSTHLSLSFVRNQKFLSSILAALWYTRLISLTWNIVPLCYFALMIT